MEELDALVSSAQEGNLESYTTLVRRFQDMAVGYAYSILGDFHLAEDAAQEAFVAAYLDLRHLREPAAFPGWFRRLVSTRCGRFIRRKRPATVVIEETAIPSAAKLPDEIVEDRERQTRVSAAIRSLPEPERAIVTLFYINQFSHREIAAFLEVPVSTVKFRLHDSRKRLKKELIDMAKKNLREKRPSRDDRLTARTFEALAALNPYQLARFEVSTDQADLLALWQSGEELREKIWGHMPPHIRAFLEEEMTRKKAKPEEIRKAQERAVETAAKLPEAPPKPGKKFLAMKEKLREKLESFDMVELGCEQIPGIFSSMAEIARLEGILSLETFKNAKDEFFATGLQLLLDGTEPAVIAEVQNPWQQTRLQHLRTRCDLIATALAEIASRRSPHLIEHKLTVLHQTSPSSSGITDKDGTAGKFKTRVGRTPFSQMDLDQLTQALMVMAWIARKRGISQLGELVGLIDDEFARTALRWLAEGVLGHFRPAPEILRDLIETRKQALLRKCDLCHTMTTAGLVSLQMGMNPRLLEFRLRNYYE